MIAGEAQGTRLGAVPEGTRPLSDRAREGLFSSLGPVVVSARCADLFAGTGAIGIEALSRGAESCDFVDSSAASIRAIRENLSRTAFTDRARVVRSEVERFLAGAEGELYDAVFMDPPHALSSGRLGRILEETRPHLRAGATVVITRHKRDATDVIPVNLQVAKRLSYGDTRVLVLEAP